MGVSYYHLRASSVLQRFQERTRVNCRANVPMFASCHSSGQGSPFCAISPGSSTCPGELLPGIVGISCYCRKDQCQLTQNHGSICWFRIGSTRYTPSDVDTKHSKLRLSTSISDLQLSVPAQPRLFREAARVRATLRGCFLFGFISILHAEGGNRLWHSRVPNETPYVKHRCQSQYSGALSPAGSTICLITQLRLVSYVVCRAPR
ncbi:hypothetical protein BKA93DRAFT_785420 [Sparassis latifolia]